MTLNNIQTLQALRQQEWPVTDYQVLDWDNAFFITAYRPGQTLMMLTNSQPLVVNRTVKEMVNEFAEAKQIWQLDTKCLRQLLVCNIPSFARLFVMTSASICACNPTKLRA